MKLKDTSDLLEVPNCVLYFILRTSHFILLALLYLHSANNLGSSSSTSAIYRLHPAMVSLNMLCAQSNVCNGFPSSNTICTVRIASKMFSKASGKVGLVLPFMVVK